MTGFAGRHLGDRAAALVDGELGTEARELALGHLAGCDVCRAEVAAQRRLKARLGQLADPPEPPELATRLQRLIADPVLAGHRATSLPAAGRDGRAGRDGASRPPRRIGSTRPIGSGPSRRPQRLRLVVVGGASAVALGVSAYVAGGSSAPAVVPNVRQLSVEHASTTGEVPFEVPMPVDTGTFLRQVSVP